MLRNYKIENLVFFVKKYFSIKNEEVSLYFVKKLLFVKVNFEIQ